MEIPSFELFEFCFQSMDMMNPNLFAQPKMVNSSAALSKKINASSHHPAQILLLFPKFQEPRLPNSRL
jgi:hypothetical protein